MNTSSFATPILYTSAEVICPSCGKKATYSNYRYGEPCHYCGYKRTELVTSDSKTRFDVRYARQPTFDENAVPKTMEQIDAEYTKVADVWANALGEVYCLMQGDNWSPHGEANDLIKRLGLKHTSMSVGDLVFDAAQSQWFIVAGIGFNKFKPKPYPAEPVKRSANEQCRLVTANGVVYCTEYHCHYREIGAACPPYMPYEEALKKSDLRVVK